MPHEVNLLVLIKSAERFIFVYDDAAVDALIDHVNALAGDPAYTLNRFDALELAVRARGQTHPGAPTDADDLYDQA